MDKAQKWASGVGAVLAAVLGVLASMESLPEGAHKWVMMGLAVLASLGMGSSRIGATGAPPAAPAPPLAPVLNLIPKDEQK